MIRRFIKRNKWLLAFSVVTFGFTVTAAAFTGIDAFVMLTLIGGVIGAAIDGLVEAKAKP